MPNIKYDQQPQHKPGSTKVSNVKIGDSMMAFDGAWMPDIDGALIGAKNFKELINMRYSDGGIESINGSEVFSDAALSDGNPMEIETGIHFRTNRDDDSYLLVHARSTTTDKGSIDYTKDDIGGGSGSASWESSDLHTDVSTDLQGRFAVGPSGIVAFCNQEESKIWGGEEANIADAFKTFGSDPDASSAYPIEVTEKLTNRLDYGDNVTSLTTTSRNSLVILTQAPAQGFKVYISTGNTNVANSTLSVTYWDGSSMTAVANVSDGTGKLASTGIISFDTASDAVAKNYEERYLYMYQIELTASSGTSSATLYSVTADMDMQKPTNIWDGFYRQPIQVQRFDSGTSTYEDFTLHVSESSTETLPVGLYLGQLTAADHFIVMFDDPMASFKFTMLGSLVNSADAQLDATDGVQYWDGDSWGNLSFTDTTLDTAGDSSFSQSDIVYWEAPSNEKKTTLFGTLGYAYKFSVDGTLSGDAKDDVVCDILTGVPQQKDIEVYKFPAQYKNKLMMCGYVEGNEGNRIDFSADNAPNVFNGEDTSEDGYQSIFVGSVEEITAATQLYNRFGSNIFSTFVVLKNNEVWLMTGDSPLDYELFPISQRIGCPAPHTLTTAEVGYAIGENVERNVAMWLSHQGPIMFDGAILHPLEGISSFFDPNESDSVNWNYFYTSQAWFDSTYSEWNIKIPTGVSTTLNKWLVYDIRRKKWYEKQSGLGPYLSCGVQAIATTGNQFIYSGSTDGKLYQLDTGTSWSGADMLFRVTTGDFYPSENQWDITLLRRLKFAAERMATDETVKIYYYKDTAEEQGLVVTWKDTDDIIYTNVIPGITVSGTAGVTWSEATTVSLDLNVGGSNRVTKLTKAFNETGWAHSFSFELESTTAALYKPVMWGYEWLYVRKDDTLSYSLSAASVT